jgi:hypothetical protein
MVVISKLVAAGVTQHVRMDGELDTGNFTGTFNELSHRVVCYWNATLWHEQIRRIPAYPRGSLGAVVAGRVAQGLSVGAWRLCRPSTGERAACPGQAPLGPSATPPIPTPAVRGETR